MRVFAVQAVGQFIGLGFSEHVGTDSEQRHHNGRGACRRRMGGQPVGAAESGFMSGDVVDVLDAKGQAGERPRAGAGHGNMGVPAECAQRIIRNFHHY